MTWRRLVSWVVLAVAWVALWGDLSVGNVVAGALVGAGVLALVGEREQAHGTLRPLRTLHFFAYVAWSLVKATTLVAWEVVTPTNQIVEGIIAVPLPDATPAVVTVVTAAVGLTPGTVVVEVDEEPCVLYVHVLHLRDVEQVRADLRHLEALALRAFGPASALEAAELLDGAP